MKHALLSLLLFCASFGAYADSVPSACMTAAPCLSWSFTMPADFIDNPTIRFERVWDADGANEGSLFVNSCPAIPLFGADIPANNNIEITRSWEVPASCFVKGGLNTVRATWATNQSPTVHEFRGPMTVWFTPPHVPVTTCRWAKRHAINGTQRLIYGCDTDGARTAFYLDITSAMLVRLNIMRTQPGINFGPEAVPPDLMFHPADSCDLSHLWGPVPSFCP